MQSHKRLFTLFLTPGSVLSNSPPEEVVKGHWEGKRSGWGWACTHRHFLTSGASTASRRPRMAAPREPHPLAETHALPLNQETQTEGKMISRPGPGKNKMVLEYLRQKARTHSEQWDTSEGQRAQQKDTRGTSEEFLWPNMEESEHQTKWQQ